MGLSPLSWPDAGADFEKVLVDLAGLRHDWHFFCDNRGQLPIGAPSGPLENFVRIGDTNTKFEMYRSEAPEINIRITSVQATGRILFCGPHAVHRERSVACNLLLELLTGDVHRPAKSS
jgi:hypothetical protein